MGNVPPETVIRLAEKIWFGAAYRDEHQVSLSVGIKPTRAHTPATREAGTMRWDALALSLSDPRRGSVLLPVTNILGGAGMNSRLNLSLRESTGMFIQSAL